MAVPWLCVHGHFYQPPREDPWLERVEAQDSAAPFHDWNARITAECYAPVGAARILDGAGRIAEIVNLYSCISFNFGPTLLAWLERHAPETYAAIVEADRESRRRFGGHGSALAQAYNHPILPLAPRRDKVTQVRWGVADFQHRFGRPPEGMWLPETAVDTETLEVLAEEGIRFTVLAPHQARRVRPPGGAWQPVGPGGVDPRRPYLVRLPSGRSVAVFFYHGPVARAVAFEGLLANGDALLGRLLGIAHQAPGEAPLVHIATDGETYGHHHRFGEMALAWALRQAQRRGLARLTNYGEYLELHPPTWEAEVAEGTSWSCAHGVERWRANCGCRLNPQTSQAWRGPLRAALEWLREVVDQLYAREGEALLRDPWQARDAAVGLHLGLAPPRREELLARHAARPFGPQERVRALQLLEMQRHAQLMFTSCGWFFDDIGGLEAVQVLRYAVRAAELAEAVGGRPLLGELEARLAAAPGNDPALPDGGAVLRRLVLPRRTPLPRLAARGALLALFPECDPQLPGARVSLASRGERSGRAQLASGRLEVEVRATGERGAFTFAAVHYGDHTVLAGVRPASPDAAGEPHLEEIRAAFRRADLAGVVRAIDRDMAHTATLADLPPDDRREVVRGLLAAAVADARAVYRTLYHAHAPLLTFVHEVGVPAPPELLTAATRALAEEVAGELAHPLPDPRRLAELLEEGRQMGLQLDGAAWGPPLESALARLLAAVEGAPGQLEPLQRLVELLRLLPHLPGPVNLWQAETRYHALRRRLRRGQWGSADPAWREAFAALGALLRFAPDGE